MDNAKNNLLTEVANYYSDKLARYGDTARGVDWNDEKDQLLRFEQLCKITQGNNNGFSVNDLGCGYGALLDYLTTRHSITSYLGVDVSEDMVRTSLLRNKDKHTARFIVAAEPDRTANYGIASGIFNVRLSKTDAEWFSYLQTTMDILDKTSSRGFAFNCLTSYSDQDKKRDRLYYADPCQLFDLCKRRYSRHVTLLHDYGLYEFTILVRKF